METMTLQSEVLTGGERQSASSFRRRTARVDVGESVYTLWSCDGREGLSRVRDLGLGGLFIESPVEQDLGAPVKLDFLADEGQIRANAIVRHVRLGKGAGLKLIAINDQDCQRLTSLIRRMRVNTEVCRTGNAGQ